jgi:glycosyltransferase involved in cell wall biosynthesis
VADLVRLSWTAAAEGAVAVVDTVTVVDGRSRRRWHEVAATRALAAAHGPVFRHQLGEDGPLRMVIDVATPNRRVARQWGDVHLAEALARSLRRRGVEVRVRTADDWDDPAGAVADVRLVLRGRQPARRIANHHHVLWVISHPSTLTDEECDDADLVLVASEAFADELRKRTTTPVEVLLQATDHLLFRPGRRDPRLAAPIGFVGHTRDVFRPVVRDALAAGFQPAIWGGGWDVFVDRRLVRGTYVRNAELPGVYRSLDVVLNDHWSDMRRWGFVSNRCFDAVACGAVVVSDDIGPAGDLFDGAVVGYRTVEELREVVGRLLAAPEERRRLGEQGRAAVVAGHTFDHRARQLLRFLAAVPR